MSNSFAVGRRPVVTNWTITVAGIQALVVATLRACAEGELAKEALRTMIMAEELENKYVLDEVSDSLRFKTQSFALVSRALSSKENISMLPGLLDSLMGNTSSPTLPSRSLLSLCQRLSLEQGDAGVEDHIKALTVKLGYSTL